MPMTATGEAEVGCWDSVLLEQLHEDAFIDNLHTRYQHDHIYTSIGTYLVAVNPFRPLPNAYGQSRVDEYATRNPFRQPPHIYGLTNIAYQNLLDHNEDQCILLSGESNAGKTETARLIVHFLSQVADARRTANSDPRHSSTNAVTSATSASVADNFSRQTSNIASRNDRKPHQHQQYPPQPERPKQQHPLSRPRSVGSVPSTSASTGARSNRNCSNTGLLKKQRSMEIARARKTATHEKSVDFDFSHRRSTDNLYTSSTTSCHQQTTLCSAGATANFTEATAAVSSAATASGATHRHCAASLPHCQLHEPMRLGLGTPNQPTSDICQHSCTAHTAQTPYNYSRLAAYDVSAIPHPNHCKSSDTSSARAPQCHASCSCTETSRLLSSHQHKPQCSGSPGSPIEAMRSAERARHRSAPHQPHPAATGHSQTSAVGSKKILKNPIQRSWSGRENRSSLASSQSSIAAEGQTAITGIGIGGHPSAGGQMYSVATTASGDLSTDGLVQMRDRIAHAEVFLEAVGNATTERNFNASRYGKFYDIEIDFKGDLIAGHITHYMLEKSRITMYNPGERNFHIFYQLLSGADIQFLKILKLQRNVDKYTLLRNSSANEDDRCNFAYTKRSLELLGFGADELLDVFTVLAVILKLGNLNFVPQTQIDGSEGCAVINDYELEEVAELLHIDAQILLNCMTREAATASIAAQAPLYQQQQQPTHRRPQVVGDQQAALSASVFVSLADTAAAAADRRRSLLCRTLYSRLFAWLVNRINQALKPAAGRESRSRQRGHKLGVLDLCGFEQQHQQLPATGSASTDRTSIHRSSTVASFEQLCINYADERLHQHYLCTVIRYQNELYAREGLELTAISCFDNAAICELLDRPQFGVLSLLDEPVLQRCCAGETDEIFGSRLRQCCAGHPSFVCGHETPPVPALPELAGLTAADKQLSHSSKPLLTFQIRHFAGLVTYATRDLIAKNTDPIPRHICATLHRHSRLSIVQNLFPEGAQHSSTATAATAGAGPSSHTSAPPVIISQASALRTQIATLLQLLRPRKAHYVFCLTPSARRKCTAPTPTPTPPTQLTTAANAANVQFELGQVQHQVRYHSLLPLVRLWRTGHCHSIEHQRFIARYKMLNHATWPHPQPGGSDVAAVAHIVHGLPLPAAEFTIGIRRVLLRSPRTVYELEGFRRSRLNDLACLVQTVWRGWCKRRQFLRQRNSQLVIASAWRTWRECRFGIPFTGRRHLWGLYRVARAEYKAAKFRQQVQWATEVIQRQYIQWKRRQFLRTLPLRLPANSSSPLCTEWVMASPLLLETAQLLRHIFHRWRCHRYRRYFDQTARNRMREKVTASIIFRDRKASYARSVAHPFVGDYVRLRQNVQWKKICVETNDQYVVFADIINKIARSSGKFVPILLVISTSSMLLLDQRTLQIKYRVPAAEIYRLSLSPYMDDIAVFHVKADYDPNKNTRQRLTDDESGCMFQSELGRKKGDFVFQTGHVIEIVTKLFLVVQNATAKPPEVHISTEFEANFGQQTVLLTFKCSTPAHEMTSGVFTGIDVGGGGPTSTSPSVLSAASSSSAVTTKCTRRGNRMEIIV